MAENRRTFIQVGAMAAATAQLASASRADANSSLNLALIGCGGRGSYLKDLFNQQDGVQVTHVCDADQKRLAAAAGAVDGRQITAVKDMRRILDDKNVDGVIVATPDHWHAPASILACEAGKHVYVEKPMTYNLPDAVRLMDAAKASDRIVQVGTQYVTDPKYHKAYELIKAGRIGKPVSSETGYCRNSKTGEWNYYGIEKDIVPGPNLDWSAWCGPLGPQEWDPLVYHRWRRYSKFSTGIVGDLLVHQMTPLLWAIDAGWPKRVVATGVHNIDLAMDNFDQVNLTIEFDSGHTHVCWGSTCNATSPAPLVRGYKANLQLSGNNCNVVPEQIWAEDIDREKHKFQRGSSHDELRINLLQRSRDRKPPLSPIELGYKIMIIVDLAARSMWEGKAFGYDPETRQGVAL